MERRFIKQSVLDKIIAKSMEYRKIRYSQLNGTYTITQGICGEDVEISILPHEGSIWLVSNLGRIVPRFSSRTVGKGYAAVNKLNEDFGTEGAFFLMEDSAGGYDLCYKLIIDKILQEPPIGEIFLIVEEFVETIEENMPVLKQHMATN